MKLLVLSDLHVEFAAFQPDAEATKAADVVILAGDIHKGTQGIVWARKTFPDKEIIYVAGNHEFYGEEWTLLAYELHMAALMHGIHFLENMSVTLGGVRFLGATLWTNYEFFGTSRRSKAMREAEGRMVDYRRIKALPLAVKLVGRGGEVAHLPHDVSRSITGSMLSPTHTVLRHRESLAWLQTELENGDPEKTVVITHHYPNEHSTAVRYRQDLLTAAFGSKLSLDLLTRSKLWIHGHTHDSYDYRLGDSKRLVRVVCNPRGYPFDRVTNKFENPSFNPGLLVEVDAGTESRGESV